MIITIVLLKRDFVNIYHNSLANLGTKCYLHILKKQKKTMIFSASCIIILHLFLYLNRNKTPNLMNN